MKTIYKYPIHITDGQIIKAPKSAQFLSVQVQRGTPCIWALVDTDNEMVEYAVNVYGTGHICNEPHTLHFIGTIQTQGESLIWHVFVSGPFALIY